MLELAISRDPVKPLEFIAPETFPVMIYRNLPAGYPSAAQDYIQDELDLTTHMLGPRRASIFLFEIGGNSMADAGIMTKDIIIVDRAITPLDGHIVVASIGGEFICKYYREYKGKRWLVPANKEFRPIPVTEEMDVSIFGVYTGLLRKTIERWRGDFPLPRVE